LSHTKSTAVNFDRFCFDEKTVFFLLDKLVATAQGSDLLPYWFLKVIATCIAKPLAHIFNLSLINSDYPSQWKKAIIAPLPKIPSPVSCADYRPISLTPILSRLFEKAVTRHVIYPALDDPTVSPLFQDQFAFRPTGSTESALIAILHHVTQLLVSNCYVRIIALDFSKAFDTIRHSSVLSKLSKLPIDDTVFNWFVNYFNGHSHVTKFCDKVSSSANINASVFQGSAIGPSMFLIAGMDLKPSDPGNSIDKYADDSYLIVASSNDYTTLPELQAIESWATQII